MDITKEVTLAIINPADQAATSITIHDFNEADNAVFCSLSDVDGVVLAPNRVFTFESLPCETLMDDEKETIKGVSEIVEVTTV